MNLDLSVASLVRASSGGLLALFGLYLLTLRPASWRSRAIGAYHVALGPAFIFTNLLRAEASSLAVGFRVAAVLFLLAAIALAALSLAEFRRDRRLRMLFLGVFVLQSLASIAVALLVASNVASSLPAATTPATEAAALNVTYDRARIVVAFYDAAVIAAAITFALWFHKTSDAASRTRIAMLSAGLTVYPIFDKASSMLMDPGVQADSLITLPSFLVAILAWALVARGPAARAARNTSLAIAASGLVGAGTALLADDYGLVGVARLVGITIIAYAVFRGDLLGTSFRPQTIRRGSVATMGLASLFIVAQVAQEFFAAEYGLLLGGVVAGTLLFAVHPVQRTMERLTEHQTTDRARPPTSGPGVERREEVYLNALRVAVRGGRLTRAEEVHLTRLAEELGIGAGRAHELLVQAEAQAATASR